MSAPETELSKKMRRLADEGHERALELRTKADALDTASKGFFSDPQTVDVKSYMGTWARARRLWCDCSGKPLI